MTITLLHLRRNDMKLPYSQYYGKRLQFMLDTIVEGVEVNENEKKI